MQSNPSATKTPFDDTFTKAQKALEIVPQEIQKRQALIKEKEAKASWMFAPYAQGMIGRSTTVERQPTADN